MTPTDWDGWIWVLTKANAVVVMVLAGLALVTGAIDHSEKRTKERSDGKQH